MVWGQAYGEAPSPAAQDPFAAAERETHATVAANWWPAAPPEQRHQLTAARVLTLPDGSLWLFGAWARWYRMLPGDGRWHLCPPPRLTVTRMSARPLQGPPPGLPPEIVPVGPDFAHQAPEPRGFVGSYIRPEVTSRVRATVESAAALPVADHPHAWNLFFPGTPSTVAACWGLALWCAAAPVFDARLDEQFLGLWSPYRARPLPAADGPRWLTPPTLEALVGLYAERLRAGRVDAAVVVLRTMWAMAAALREDPRFQARADALLAILGVTLQNPAIDYGALPYGDAAVVQQWLRRCPPHLAPALRAEASPGEHLRHAHYDLAAALTPMAGDPGEAGYVEPRLLATAFLAADLSTVRSDVAAPVIGWLDPELSELTRAMLSMRDHPLRRWWPDGNRLPAVLRERLDAVGPPVPDALLAHMYALDLAWCRLAGGIPARPRGFPTPVAILAEILGADGATSAAAADLIRTNEPAPSPAAPPAAPPATQAWSEAEDEAAQTVPEEEFANSVVGEPVEGALPTLDELIGLDEVKNAVNGLLAEARAAAGRAAQGLPADGRSRHLVFLGRPGTGKATVAGLIGGLYASLGLLRSGHVVACDLGGPAAGGDPAAAITDHAARAAGGVLFVDDAHLLAVEPAAIAALRVVMQEQADTVVVVCAGPPEETKDVLTANPGFRTGFGAVLEFAEPTDRQLVQMFSKFAERDLYVLDEELRVELLGRFAGMRGSPGFAYATTVREMFEQTRARQAARLVGAAADTATVARLTVRDLPESPMELLLGGFREDGPR